MRYKIISSSSKGNCYLFEDYLIIDLGISIKKLKENIDISKIKYVFLTHIHGDHFKFSTIRHLFVNTNCVFVAGEWLKDELEKIAVIGNRIKYFDFEDNIKIFKAGNFKISPVKAYHDVPNCGYRLLFGKHKHLHITDTSTLRGITAKGYDSVTIECNHCKITAQKIIDKAKNSGEFCHLSGAINSHLSVQEAIDFIKNNGIKGFEPCHIGDSTKEEVLKEIKEAIEEIG